MNETHTTATKATTGILINSFLFFSFCFIAVITAGKCFAGRRRRRRIIWSRHSAVIKTTRKRAPTHTRGTTHAVSVSIYIYIHDETDRNARENTEKKNPTERRLWPRSSIFSARRRGCTARPLNELSYYFPRARADGRATAVLRFQRVVFLFYFRFARENNARARRFINIITRCIPVVVRTPHRRPPRDAIHFIVAVSDEKAIKRTRRLR